MKVVILAGGLGTRMREETEFIPKPMVRIGDRPIVWHIIKYFLEFGHSDFLILGGYKTEVISDYFSDLDSIRSDLNQSGSVKHANQVNIQVVDTGQNTPTGGRLFLAKKFLQGKPFMCVYGDTLADVAVQDLQRLHARNPQKNILTATRPRQRFGIVEVDTSGLVTSFREKPVSQDLVNIGFFLFVPSFLEGLTEHSVLEEEPLVGLCARNSLMALIHEGYWKPMDTYRELLELQELWDTGDAPWKIWD